MSKKQFTLDLWLKDKSQKVVTRCGFPVRIVCTDVKRKDYPILALVERDDQEEYQSFTKDGRFSLYNPLHDNFDLFIETADEVSEDEKILEIIKHCIESRYLHTSTIKGISQKQCLAWLEKQSEQKPEENKGNIGGISSNSAWSEEDECYMSECIGAVATKDGWSFEEKRKTKHWLKSLQYRVQPQPKQEWSEEDKYMYDILCGTIENTDINENTKYKLISWLKSLRPQNRWKPSELQLGCLSDAIEHYNSLGYPAPKLKELLDDLKKLKEGKV